MRYYYPDYFKDFVCIGGKACSDSCCHIWQITVDKKTLRKYKHVTGELGKRMAEKIDQKTGDICPHGEENRCEFLNEDNLCDIVAKLGEDYLCPRLSAIQTTTQKPRQPNSEELPYSRPAH